MTFNTGLQCLENKTVDNFTTITGLKIRRTIHGPLRYVLDKATKGRIILESYPDLEKDRPYIFASTHYHPEDIISNLATLDRNAYALIGTTDQLEHNPQMYAAWLNGIVYVDRQNKESRSESLKKMQFLIENGTSTLLYVEGGWNNTENLLCQKIFSGAYKLSLNTKECVVPISNFLEPMTNEIFIRYGHPLELYKYTEKEAIGVLRDELATMMFEQIFNHSIPLIRSELSGDIHLEFMEERRKMYLQNKWTRDVWDEELTVYKPKDIVLAEDVRKTLDIAIDNLLGKLRSGITSDSIIKAKILIPTYVRRQEDEKYNFNKYMHENWNK